MQKIYAQSCFVATAVYGDSHAPQVETLREFRDHVLAQNPFGQKFIDFYYSGAGQKAAQVIQEHLPTTIPFIRKGLDFLVTQIESRKTEENKGR
ncbi:hypothetical protein HY498_05355 [Candidatus Woesearchaeota archaeon]|nr:hypothetical protein [Candidatus Woesearchaeota archaeon]